MEESDLKSEMEHKKDSAARMSLRASDFKFGESDIEKGEISEMELKTELTSKATDAPLSFIISTDAAKIKIQLYDDIGEKKINALMQGINAVTNSVLGIDAAQDASFSQKNNGSFKAPLPYDEECF